MIRQPVHLFRWLVRTFALFQCSSDLARIVVKCSKESLKRFVGILSRSLHLRETPRVAWSKLQACSMSRVAIRSSVREPSFLIPMPGSALHSSMRKPTFRAALGLLAWGCAMALYANANDYSVLRSFAPLEEGTGVVPRGSLMQGADGTIYGTTAYAGAGAQGTVFKIQPDGGGFAVLKYFTNALEGALPEAGVIISGATLYGTTRQGGSAGSGTVFRMNTDGTGFAVLKEFNEINEGTFPEAGLALDAATLYGVTYYGGSSNWGAIFKLSTNGTDYTVLRSFDTRVEGATDLVVQEGRIYGATRVGGSGYGTVFRMNTDGSGYVVLKSFSGQDGASPSAGLVLSGTTLFGATSGGGSFPARVFRIEMDGSGFAVIKTLPLDDGQNLKGRLVLSGTTLYGRAANGGVIFKVETNGTGYTVLTNFPDYYEPHTPGGGMMLIGSTLFGVTESGGSARNGSIFRIHTNGNRYADIKSFNMAPNGNGPYSTVVVSGSTLYGTTGSGGTFEHGTIFKVGTDGSGYSVIKHFAGVDGDYPASTLTLFEETLYGTTVSGGALGYGTVYKVRTDGGDFTLLKNFDYTDQNGASPHGSLLLSGAALFGTTTIGGSAGMGTLYSINTDGTGFRVLRSFSGSDGAGPKAGVILNGTTLYGTANSSGSNSNGVIFRIETNGEGFSILKSFAGDDGRYPDGDLIIAGNALYGTTSRGGMSNLGTVFKINLDGTGFSVLKHFTEAEGSLPVAGLARVGNTLFGTTLRGGSADNGTLFSVWIDGSGFTVLKNFAGADGVYPFDTVAWSGTSLYGTTAAGGQWNGGTLFRVDFPPARLSIAHLTDRLLFTWPASPFLFQLESSDTISNGWVNVLEPATVSTDTVSVTMPLPPANTFFRLHQP
jgi:uncharacterized repeat protein (TIGR03803 family)